MKITELAFILILWLRLSRKELVLITEYYLA